MSTPKFCNVIDVEATCWPKDGFSEQMHRSEIIEIGITRIRMSDRQIVDSESIFVKPTKSEISEFCTSLTTLTPEFIENRGISFVDATQRLMEEYKTHKYMWASWGDYDRKMFDVQCSRERIPYPFNSNHLNVKSLFCWKYGFSRGVSRALDEMVMTFKGTPHRGIDDSYNIARILLDLTR